MSGSPLRWPTKQVCIKCPFTQDLSSSPTSLYIYIYIYSLKESEDGQLLTIKKLKNLIKNKNVSVLDLHQLQLQM